MAHTDNKYSLNTENFTLISSLAEKLHHVILENDEILLRLNTLVDTKLRLPNLKDDKLIEEEIMMKNNEKRKHSNVPVESTADFKSEISEMVNSIEAEFSHISNVNNREDEHSFKNEQMDILRPFLDVKLDIGKVSYDEKAFQGVYDSRVRQLLIDNYRLLRIKKDKQAANRDAWDTCKSYERLIGNAVLPSLMQNVSRSNIDQIKAARERLLSQKFPGEDFIWQIYCKYFKEVETIRLVCQKLTGILQAHILEEQMHRLSTQIDIVDDLMKHALSGSLRHNRSYDLISLR